MLKYDIHINRRFRKKKDKKSAGKPDIPFENSVDNSDDQNSDVASLASERLSSNSKYRINRTVMK